MRDRAAADAAYYRANRERKLAYQAAYNATHREQVRRQKAAHRRANRPRLLEKDRAYRVAHPRPPEVARDTTYRRKYGISTIEYDALLDFQEGVCALCRQPPKEGARLHVDHDHDVLSARASVRGLLCPTCNRLLDQPDGWFERALNYKANPPGRVVLGVAA